MRRNFRFVSNEIFGLNIKAACCIHDWQYTNGPKTKRYKRQADRTFHKNLLFLIDQAGGSWFIRQSRKAQAWLYFQAVFWFGDNSFYSEIEVLGEHL